jgi:hypothetical protein
MSSDQNGSAFGYLVIDNLSHQVDSTQCQRLSLRRNRLVDCSYNTPLQTATQTRLPETGSEWTLSSESSILPLSQDYLLAIAQFGWPKSMLPDEKFLLYHLCAIRKDIMLVTERGFSVGISQFSR